MPYNPTTALLENNVRAASANVHAYRLNLHRQREYQQQLREAQAVLDQHRRQLSTTLN